MKCLPKADDARFDAVSHADVDQYDMVLRMVDHVVEPRNQVGVPPTAQPALENREYSSVRRAGAT